MGFPVFVDSIRRIASLVPSNFRDGIEAAVAARGSIFYMEIAPIQSVLTSTTLLHPTRMDLPSLFAR